MFCFINSTAVQRKGLLDISFLVLTQQCNSLTGNGRSREIGQLDVIVKLLCLSESTL